MSIFLKLIPGRLLWEFGIAAVLGIALYSTWTAWLSEREAFTTYRAQVTQQAKDQERAVREREAAQEARNARTIESLQAAVADSDRRGADLAGRLSKALADASALRKAQDIGPIVIPARVPESTGIVERLAAYDAACIRDAAKLSALQEEVRGQL